ncbi:hypothetical protein JXL19_11245 [bacterium]|nr:hypothetical protein [bacterium]
MSLKDTSCWGTIFFCVLICHASGVNGTETGHKIKKHMVIHGASELLKTHAHRIADEYQFVITEWWKYKEVAHLKGINKNIRVLFYRDCIGMLPSYDDWKVINKNDPWFVKDQCSGKRLCHRKHHWYLMDITNQGFRDHLVNYIADKLRLYTDFDGVFLDDAHTGIAQLDLLIEGEKTGAMPRMDPNFVRGYYGGLITFLKQLKNRLQTKMVFINTHDAGDHIEPSDGVMVEGFVHGCWQDKDEFISPDQWVKDVQLLERLLAQNKYVLVHSGTQGDIEDPGARRQFEFCLASYLLGCGDRSSFSFQDHDGPLLPEYREYHMPFGRPIGPPAIPAIKINPIFQDSCEDWSKWPHHDQGCMDLDSTTFIDGKSSLVFHSHNGQGCYLEKYIPLPNRINGNLSLSCWSKASGIEYGDASWQRFALLGAYCDSEGNIITRGIDLPFDTGSFDWRFSTYSHIIPKEASYFRVTYLGLVPGSQGTGWIDDLEIAIKSLNKSIYSREFEHVWVWVNPTSRPQQAPHPLTGGMNDSPLKMAPHAGAIIEKRQGMP